MYLRDGFKGEYVPHNSVPPKTIYTITGLSAIKDTTYGFAETGAGLVVSNPLAINHTAGTTSCRKGIFKMVWTVNHGRMM